MAGGAVEYSGALAANSQLTAGIPFGALGIANPPPSEEWDIQIEVNPAARTYQKTVRRQGALVGAILLGWAGASKWVKLPPRAGSQVVDASEIVDVDPEP